MQHSQGLLVDQLNAGGIPYDEILLNDTDLSPAKYKAQTLLNYRATHPEPNADLTAFFENERANVVKAREVVPDMLTLRVFSRPNVKTGKQALFFSKDDGDIYKIWARALKSCREVYQNF